MPNPVPVISNVIYGKDADGNQIVEWDETTTITNHVVKLASELQSEIDFSKTVIDQTTQILKSAPIIIEQTISQPVGP